MYSKISKTIAAAATAAALATSVNAATVTQGPGGFDDGWATTITYDDAAARGSSGDRDNGLNALGAADGSFFELGFGGYADFTFGAMFDASVTVYEITFGSAAGWPEAVRVLVGSAGSFTELGTITNAAAATGATLSATLGMFDTVRLIDATDASRFSSRVGGFDVDAVRVAAIAPVPLPAGAVLLLTGLAGAFVLRRKQA